jgi:aminoglycoside 6'-N-acetyltransferase I
MNIRPVTEADGDEWARMRANLFADSDPGEIHDWFGATDEAGRRSVGVAVLVADRGDGNLAGFVEIGSRNYAEGCESTPVAYIEGWYVDPDVRREGLGRRLVQAAEAWAISRGFTEMASDTELHNDVSLKAHTALGYGEVERQICFKKSLGPGDDIAEVRQ